MRHVIVEGCDGSGKTGLIDSLAGQIDLVRHPRASDSITGPVSDLRGWVNRDLEMIEDNDFDPPFIYDRHPLISELIYSKYRWVNPGLAPGFSDPMWVSQASRRLAKETFLIICAPPYEEVERVLQAQGREAHMPGVFENRYSIWTRYNTFLWPGKTIRYDRTRETPQDLIKTLENI